MSGRHVAIVTLVCLGTVLALAAPSRAAGEAPEEHSIPGHYPAMQKHETQPGVSSEENRWFLLFAGVNAHPKLGSEELLDDYFDPAMRLLAPTFDDVRTIGDLRDDYMLWPPHVGVGRILSDRWAVFLQAGYSAGKVRTEANDPSILLLPLHTDVEIKRGALYTGIGADYFPFGMPVQRKYHGVFERLRAARPSLGARITWTRATYRAKVKVGFQPLGNLLSLELSDRWLLPSVNANVGLDVPLTRRNALTMNAGYNIFAGRRADFDGPAYTVGLKYFLPGPSRNAQRSAPTTGRVTTSRF